MQTLVQFSFPGGSISVPLSPTSLLLESGSGLGISLFRSLHPALPFPPY